MTRFGNHQRHGFGTKISTTENRAVVIWQLIESILRSPQLLTNMSRTEMILSVITIAAIVPSNVNQNPFIRSLWQLTILHNRRLTILQQNTALEIALESPKAWCLLLMHQGRIWANLNGISPMQLLTITSTVCFLSLVDPDTIMPLTLVTCHLCWPGFNFHIVSSFELFIQWNVMQCGLDWQISGTNICKQIAHKSINGQPKRAGREWIWYLITRDVSSHWAWLTIETRTVSEITAEACHQKLFGTKLFSSSLQSVWMGESQENKFYVPLNARS